MADEVRLINYDAAIDRYYAEYEKQDICDGAQDRDWLKKCFDEVPTIDPESLRPKGRWEEKKEYDFKERDYFLAGYTCSCCGFWYLNPIKYKYCPNCGADMREG